MLIYLLGVISIATLIINILLLKYLLKEKLGLYSTEAEKGKIVNFVLTPFADSPNILDTEPIQTEIIYTDID